MLLIGQRLNTPNFSAFYWSPRGSPASFGQHFLATRVVHLPKSTETSLITESDQSGPNHQLLQLCTARKAWTRLCGPCIAVIAGLQQISGHNMELVKSINHFHKHLNDVYLNSWLIKVIFQQQNLARSSQ